MKKIFLFFLTFAIISDYSYPQEFIIKSLKIYPAIDQTAFPVMLNNESFIIEFDIDADYEPSLNIVFRFCDRNWNPYDNLFLANNGQNIEYNLSFSKLPLTVEDARYRFRRRFPNSNNYVSFPFSGKWAFYITDSQDSSIVYASGKFIVINPEVPIHSAIKKELLEDKVYSPLELGRVFNITTDFNLPDEMFPNFVSHVEIIKNKEVYYPIIIDRNFNTNKRQYYWDGNRKFSFIARDILPGNEYRQTDTRDYNRFNAKNVKAQFDGIELSRFYKQGRPDLNGGSVFLPYYKDWRRRVEDPNAVYLNINFSFRPPETIYSDIFIVGDFNEWLVSPEYKMNNSGGLYTVELPLRRGIYDYQYVIADVINNQVDNEDWIYLEGNFWETSNIYHIFLYYTDTNYGGYDRIIGYQSIKSNF